MLLCTAVILLSRQHSALLHCYVLVTNGLLHLLAPLIGFEQFNASRISF